MIVAAGVLVRDDDGRVLMLYNVKRGSWEYPGGKCDPGEDPMTGARRECLEELGFVPNGVWRYLDSDQVSNELVYHTFECIVYPDEAAVLLAADEHSGWEWMHPADAVARCNPDYASRLAELL